MTTITAPTTTNTGSVLIGAIVGALAMLILMAVIALAAVNVPALLAEPAPAPAPMTNAANSDDPTPLSGILEFAD
jgi:hypothetical protein